MISNVQKQQIKAVLGSKYSGAILQHITPLGYVNKKGKPYSIDSIQKIVRGGIENLEVELQIAYLVNQKKQAKIKLEKAKKKLLR